MSTIQEVAEALVNLTVKEVNELRIAEKGNEMAQEIKKKKIIGVKVNSEKASSPKFFGQNNKKAFKNNYKANINTRKNYKNHKM